MKQITQILTGLIAMSFLAVTFASAGTITVRADSWPPYNDEPGSAAPGYMIEVAKEIFAKHGHDLDYQLMPWTRSLDSVRKGSHDAVVGTDPDESPDFVFPNEAFGINQNGFFAKKGSSWKYSGFDSVKQVRLGVIEGYGYFPELDEYIEGGKGNKKLFAATGDDALPKLLKMLAAGRIDAVIENVDVMKQALQGDKLKGEIVEAGLVDDSFPLYMAFSPAKESSKDYARIFDEGIEELRASGKLQEILSRYGLKDWK